MSVIQFIKERRIFLFFVFLAFFPTLRILLIGSGSSDTAFEFFVAALPELILATICASYFFRFLRLEKGKFHLLDVLIILYVLYNLISGFILANDISASLYSVRMTYLPMTFYFLVSFSTFSQENLEKFLFHIFRFIVFVSVLGLIMYFFFPQIQSYFSGLISDQPEKEYFIVRMTSIFWTPVVYGVIVSSAIVFWHFQYLKEKKNIHLLFIAILFISVCLSVSRGPMISTFLGIILLSIMRIDWKANAKVFGIIIGSFLLISIYISNPIDFTKWIISSTTETMIMEEGNTRADLVKDSYSISSLKKHSSLLGLGLGKAGHVAVQRFEKNRSDVSFSTTDSWYLKLMIETGYVALGFYLLILITFVISSLRYIMKNKFDIMWFIFVFGGIVCLQNIVSNVLDFYMFAYLYWFVLGLCVLILKRKKYENA